MVAIAGWPPKHSCNLRHVTVTRRSLRSWNPGGERPWQQIADLFEWVKRSPGATPIPSPADWGSRLSQPRARGSHLQSVQQTAALPKFRQVICGNRATAAGEFAPACGSYNPAVSAEQVALIPQCAECHRVWLPDDGDRWQAYFDADDELVFYCPECAEREFLER